MPELRSRLGIYAVAIEGEAVLLCRISAGYPSEGRWALPGGGVDWGEHPEHALAREVFEESGLELRSFEFLGLDSVVRDTADGLNQIHLVRLIYTAPLSGDPRVTEIDGSVCEVRWVPLTELGATELSEVAVAGLAMAGIDCA